MKSPEHMEPPRHRPEADHQPEPISAIWKQHDEHKWSAAGELAIKMEMERRLNAHSNRPSPPAHQVPSVRARVAPRA